MASLLEIPQEVRDQIWAHLLHDPTKSSHVTCGSPTRKCATRKPAGNCKSLMHTSRQLIAEITPYLYYQVQLDLENLNDFLSWVNQIGPKHTILIRNLILRTCSLSNDDSAGTWATESAWALALRSLPRLRTLTFQVSHAKGPATKPLISRKHQSGGPSSQLLHNLSLLAHACSEVPMPTGPNNIPEAYQPDNLRSHGFTHAFFSLHEPMPPIFLRYLEKVLLLPKPTDGSPRALQICSDSRTLETDIIGVPAAFFQQNGYRHQDTYAFNENNENANAIWTFARTPLSQKSPIRAFKAMMRGLPNLGYLRLGCRDLDSLFLIHLPRHLHTLDVAFTDDDAERVAENLMTMRGICRNLFTLAIAVSPLHDRPSDNKDPRPEVFFERSLVSKEIAEKWAPFWIALDEIKASKVKTWEGEGPGFRRQI